MLALDSENLATLSLLDLILQHRPYYSGYTSVVLDIASSPTAANLHVDLSQVLAVVRHGCLLGRFALAVVTAV